MDVLIIIMLIFFGILFSICIVYTIYYFVHIIGNCVIIHNNENQPLIEHI